MGWPRRIQRGEYESQKEASDPVRANNDELINRVSGGERYQFATLVVVVAATFNLLPTRRPNTITLNGNGDFMKREEA